MKYEMRVSKRVVSHPMNDDVIQNGISADVLTVSFDSEWHGVTDCRAVFTNLDTTITVPFSGAETVEIPIPWEVLRYPGWLQVGFIGLPSESKRITTRLLDRPVKVAQSCHVAGPESEPTVDVISDLLARASKALADATAALEKADVADRDIRAAEAARVKAETSRAAAESSRSDAEARRAGAEAERARAESARATSEEERAAAEALRGSAETQRAAAENAREGAERDRSGSEAGRAKAESDRAAAEKARVTAEEARAESEADRERRTAEAVSKADTAAARADEAAKGASENVLVGTETATVVHVEDAWPTLLRECKVLGKSVQEGTPTPDFPQPITSVGKAEVVVTGKNLAQTMKGVSSKGITGTVNDDGSYHVAGTTTAAYANPFTPVDVYLPAGRHTLSGNLPSKNGKSALYAQVMVDGVYNTTSSGAKTFDVARPGTYGVSVTTPEAGATYDGDFTVQLELGTGATEFAKPSSSATPIDLQGHELRSLPTGVRDEVVVDRDGNVSLVKRVGSHIVLTVTNVASTESFQYAFIEVEDRPINGDYRFMCNRFGVGQRRPGCVYVAGGSRAAFFFCFELGTFTSKQEAEQWFADNPTQVVYQLAEPQTIPLGKVSVPALPESTSNVWNNDAISTEVSATYVRDVNIAFSELESRLTQAVLATAANI